MPPAVWTFPAVNHPHVYEGRSTAGRDSARRHSTGSAGDCGHGRRKHGGRCCPLASALGSRGRPSFIAARKLKCQRSPAEVEQAKQEGVEFRFLAAPGAVVVEGGTIVAHRVLPDAAGRARCFRKAGADTVPDSMFRIPVSGVVSAIGETVDGGFLPEGLRALARGRSGGYLHRRRCGHGRRHGNRRRRLRTAHCRPSRQLSQERPRSGQGADPAKPVAASSQYSRRSPISSILNQAYFSPEARPPITTKTCQSPTSFAELVEGFGAEPALSEARRCLACGTCNGCLNCYYWCPDMAVHGSSAERSPYRLRSLQRMRNMR